MIASCYPYFHIREQSSANPNIPRHVDSKPILSILGPAVFNSRARLQTANPGAKLFIHDPTSKVSLILLGETLLPIKFHAPWRFAHNHSHDTI